MPYPHNIPIVQIDLDQLVGIEGPRLNKVQKALWALTDICTVAVPNQHDSDLVDWLNGIGFDVVDNQIVPLSVV
jgi:hypothetical protein